WRAVRTCSPPPGTRPALPQSASRFPERKRASPAPPTCPRICASPETALRPFGDGDLLGVVDLDPRHAVHFLDRALGGSQLRLEVIGPVGDAGGLEALRSLLGDDHREVFLALEVFFRVEVDLAALLQTVLRGLHLHLDCDLLAHLLAGLDGPEGR